jgi:hypothetical protein
MSGPSGRRVSNVGIDVDRGIVVGSALGVKGNPGIGGAADRDR